MHRRAAGERERTSLMDEPVSVPKTAPAWFVRLAPRTHTRRATGAASVSCRSHVILAHPITLTGPCLHGRVARALEPALPATAAPDGEARPASSE